MSTVGRVISSAPVGRAREWVAAWAPSARLHVRERMSIPAALAWELARIFTLVTAGVVAHSWNLFLYPRYQADEGVYMSSAWSLAHGSVTPYTYTYGHPPLGWALIAAWCELTGGFFTFGTAINTGRVFMVVVYAVSAVFVYLIALRLTRRWQTAAIATAIFSFSPLSITFQREVLLDNIATMWLLVALYLLVVSESRLRYLVASAAVFGVAVLTKETLIVVLPAFAIVVWRGVTPFQRRYVTLVSLYVSVGIISSFVLVALLKNEFFPSGTLLGGSAPHVSMLQTFGSQASRGGQQGSLAEQWRTWTGGDFVIMLGGLGGMLVNLYLYRKKPWAQGVALLPLFYFLFLARGGVTFAYYIIVVLPLLALNIALFFDFGIAGPMSDLIREARPDAQKSSYLRVGTLATLVALVMLGVYVAPRNHANFTTNAVTPETEALQWMANNAPRSAMIVGPHYLWLDMRASGGMGATVGAPFANYQMYWNVATDKSILDGVFHNDWNMMDYVIEDPDMKADISGSNMQIFAVAIAHSKAVAHYQNTQFWITIYQIQHVGDVAQDNAARASVITQVSSSGIALVAPGATALTQTTPRPPPGVQQRARVTASALNLRSGPDLSASIFTQLAYGSVVTEIDRRGAWAYVSTPRGDGWVASAWLAALD